MAKREKYTTGKDGYKRYQITYVDASGNTCRKRLTARTDREMDEKIKQFNRSIGSGDVGYDITTTAREWSEYWLEATKKGAVAPSTYYAYRSFVNRFNDQFGSRILSSITPIELNASVKKLTDMSSSTIIKYRNTIKAIFDAAEENGLIRKTPAGKLSRFQGSKGTHRNLTDDEILTCIKAAQQHRFGLCVMLMLFGGLRRGEALYFDVDRDVDFDTWIMTIRGAYHFDKSQAIPGSTKSDAGLRSFLAPPPLRPFLTAHKGCGCAFTPQHGGPLTLISVDRAWESFITTVSDLQNGFTKRWPKKDENGNPLPYIRSDIRTHDLRHTAATMLFDADVDVKTAQKILGHSNVSITLEIYAHLTEEKRTTSETKAFSYYTKYA